MNSYVIGSDILGAHIGAATPVYQDKETVKRVQQAILDSPQAKTDSILQLGKADGVIGPKTLAAVTRFNAEYRKAPQDSGNITDGLLTALLVSPAAPPDAFTVNGGKMTAASGSFVDWVRHTPKWRLGVGAAGGLSILTGFVLLAVRR